MTRILIYLFPAIMDVMLGTVFFVSQSRVADTGKAALYTTSIIAVWAFVYMIMSQVAGRITTPANSAWLIITGSVINVLCSIAYLVFPSILPLYIIIIFVGVGAALFFTPFQVFMKTVDSDRPQGISFSTGLYTFSWSTGLAMGPFISGFVMDNFSWKYCHVMDAVLAASAGIGILILRHHGRQRPEPAATDQETVPQVQTRVDYSVFPDLAWLGWLAAGVGCLTVASFRAYYPDIATNLAISKSDQGMTLALAGCVQGVTGLLLCRSRTWMYRVWPCVLFGLSGILGLTCFGLAGSNLLFNVGAVFYGVYCGSFFFYLVFHSLVHPEKSGKYIAVNESVVGITSVAGPLVAGYLARQSMSLPFFVFAAITIVAVVLQIYFHGIKYRITTLLKT